MPPAGSGADPLRALLLAVLLMGLSLPATASALDECLASDDARLCLPLVARATAGDLEAAVARAASSLRDVTGRDAALVALAPSAVAFALYVERECERRRLMLDAGTGAGAAELACRAQLRAARAEALWGEVGGRPELFGLDDREWRLVAIDGEPVLDGTAPTLRLEEAGQAGGDASTNRWFAGYVRHGLGLAFGAAGSTMMFNDEPPGRMAQEQRFLQALGSVDRVMLADDRLNLLAAGRVVLRFE